jgi:3D (Asp-Asp-Asp) domain-containing protein
MWVRLSLGVLCLVCLFALAGDAQMRVTVTAYSSYESPGRTASGLRPKPGMLAVSRDVERLLGLHFGDRVLVGGVPYLFEDRMAVRWTRRIDLFAPSYAQARQFGIQRGVVLTRVAARP